MDVSGVSREQAIAGLREQELPADPIEQFRLWFEMAQAAGLPQPEAMTLATATPDGRPSARIVLLKRVDEQGFLFFTNYESRKGRELGVNPRAALVFFWSPLHRQVRVEGPVEVASAAESDIYFQSRPRGSQLGALASRQSEVITGRDVLEGRVEALRRRYAGDSIPRPACWGGYRVVPLEVEFWQGQEDRLHDRLRYRRTEDGRWQIERLSP
jgi:pyridoxamine 5'-phosphate oxidase